jgi:hypothetical protein
VSESGPVPGPVLGARLVQPDHRSCGAAVLVVARALLDQGYAELLVSGRHPGTGLALPGSLADRFRHEALAMHARVTGPVDAAGRLQVPWPRALGTPPWAVARQLSATGGSAAAGGSVASGGSAASGGAVAAGGSGGAVAVGGGLPRVRHRVVPAWPDRGALLDRIVAATAEGRPVPVYVGNRWAPRHVVLFLGGSAGRGDGLRCYDPARGWVVDVDRRAFVRGRLGLGRWDQPWFAVLPELPSPPAAVATGRRSRA